MRGLSAIQKRALDAYMDRLDGLNDCQRLYVRRRLTRYLGNFGQPLRGGRSTLGERPEQPEAQTTAEVAKQKDGVAPREALG
jgi:hypothetical protein